MSSNFRIVLKFKDITISDVPKENIEGKIEIGENIKYFKLPIKEVITFEIDKISPSIGINGTFFDSNGKKTLGSFNIPLPADLNEKEEYELDKEFSIQTSQRNIHGQYFLAIFNRKFLQNSSEMYARNDNSFQETTFQTTQENIRPVLSNQKSAKVEKVVNNAVNSSKTPEKSKTVELNSKSKVSQKSKNVYNSSSKKTNSNLNTSVNNKVRVAKQENINVAINKSIHNASQMADAFDKDNKEISECIYLNKLNNTDINIDEYGNESKILNNNKLSNEDINTLVPNRKELDSYRETFDLSPEKLKARYRDLEKSLESSKKKGLRSLSPAGNTKDLDYSIVKNELWKYSNEHKNQIDYLKLMVFALESKLKASDNIRKENDLLKIELKKSEESRNELQQSIRETTQELKNESFNAQKNFNKLMQDKVQVDEKLKDMNKKLENALQNYENARVLAKNLENEVKEAKISLKNYEDIKIQMGYLKAQLQQKELRINEVNDNFANKLKEIQRLLSEAEQQKDQLFQEKVRINSELNEARQKLEYEQNRLKEKQNDLDSLKRKNQLLITSEGLLKSTQDDKKKIEDDLKDARNHIEDLNNLIEKLKMDVIGKNREMDDKEKRLIDKNSLLEQQINALDIKLNEQNNSVANLQKNLSDAKNNISTLEQLLCLKEDINNQLDFAKEKVEKLTKENQDYKHQITLLTDQIVVQDNKTYDLQNIINHMRDLLNEKEEYIINLKKLILEMREKGGAYVPFRDDPVDKKLADFINSLNDPDRVKVMFIREGQGVYQFGTKKVFVKIDQEKIFIRVGGGFISIEDFLQIYTPLELEKMLRNDPVKILTKNIAINKTIAGRCVKEIEKTKTTQINSKSLAPLFSKVKSNEKI